MIGFGQTAKEYFNQGNDCLDKGDHEEAIYYYTKAIKIDPDFADAYRARAWEYESLQMYKESIEDFTKGIIIIGPDNRFLWEWYQNRGIAYSSFGKTEEAIADYTKSIKLYPNESAYANRANQYCFLGKCTEAVADYTRCIILEPKNPYWYWYRSQEKAHEDLSYCSDVKKAWELKGDSEIIFLEEWYYIHCN